MTPKYTLEPIATFRCNKVEKSWAAHQASHDRTSKLGEIKLKSWVQPQKSLKDLEGFTHLWLIYLFHLSIRSPKEFRPLVRPPRSPKHSRGVFATRAPYRPNNLGLSCVRLEKIEGCSLWVSSYDLLDGTPILDIKPYLPENDSFPEASSGWVQSCPETEVQFSPRSLDQLSLVEKIFTGLDLKNTIEAQLRFSPLDPSRKRIRILNETDPTTYELSLRFFRIHYQVQNSSSTPDKMPERVQVLELNSWVETSAGQNYAADPKLQKYSDELKKHLAFVQLKVKKST